MNEQRINEVRPADLRAIVDRAKHLLRYVDWALDTGDYDEALRIAHGAGTSLVEYTEAVFNVRKIKNRDLEWLDKRISGLEKEVKVE